MAIDKKLIHFKTKENFNSANGVNGSVDAPTAGSEANGNAEYGQIKGTSIVFIKDSGEIWTHGNLYRSVNWSVLTVPGAGDIAYWDGSSVKLISKNEWNDSLGTPIGVIVIPQGFLPDGKARIISLNSAGSPNWYDGYYTDSPLKNLDVVPITDNAGSTTTGSASYGFLPSDYFSGAQSLVDPKAKYKGTANWIPSPYLGTKLNPAYCETIAGHDNVLSDFDGLSNTRQLLESSNSYTAAKNAWNYSDGHSDIQWHLPSAGEIGFLTARYDVITNTLLELGGTKTAPAGLWTSNEYSYASVWCSMPTTAIISTINSTGTLECRPFAIV